MTVKINFELDLVRIRRKKKKKKKTYKDPTTTKNPKHPNKNPNTLYNITS